MEGHGEVEALMGRVADEAGVELNRAFVEESVPTKEVGEEQQEGEAEGEGGVGGGLGGSTEGVEELMAGRYGLVFGEVSW